MTNKKLISGNMIELYKIVYDSQKIKTDVYFLMGGLIKSRERKFFKNFVAMQFITMNCYNCHRLSDGMMCQN